MLKETFLPGSATQVKTRILIHNRVPATTKRIHRAYKTTEHKPSLFAIYTRCHWVILSIPASLLLFLKAHYSNKRVDFGQSTNGFRSCSSSATLKHGHHEWDIPEGAFVLSLPPLGKMETAPPLAHPELRQGHGEIQCTSLSLSFPALFFLFFFYMFPNKQWKTKERNPLNKNKWIKTFSQAAETMCKKREGWISLYLKKHCLCQGCSCQAFRSLRVCS